MICFPNAKINLGLYVVEKRPDGYHNLETIFYPIPVKDALEVVTAERDSFTQTGIPIEGDPSTNLVMKALSLLRRHGFPIPPVEIHLHKNIPFGAGLGGGSADAACMLTLLNDLFALRIPLVRLEELAGELGADCPFFIQNRPLFATGIGNIFTPIELSLSGYRLCLVKPPVAVPTATAYSMVTPARPAVSLPEIVKRPVAEWRELMANDFEPSVFASYPVVGEIKAELYRQGALYAAMSGSGSAVYGLFPSPTSLEALFPDCDVREFQLH
ncbi:4-(cytidine 5'-diphospho)-2-C-methyl-D-erythritol kinase [Parabacteroides sp. OttesenSCG-928-N08]|nr:4-(cytidine 5'-diphospho)-2-C-methyl-D-erythritol kinase [Parabacteroides sp. OttesenSCG-928-N08]